MNVSNDHISAGKLRHRVTLQQPVRTPDAAGGAVVTWQDIATFWAEIITVRSKDAFQADKLQLTTNFVVKIRYRSDVTSEKRLMFNGRIFIIEGCITDHEMKSVLHVFVREEG